MKSRKIILLENILRFMSGVTLKRHRPKVVAITGSVGKTSAKEAISLVLATKFNVRSAEKNYNNEIGIPLTIIGAKSGEGSVLRWIGVFLKWFFSVIFPIKYPDVLVLEMGIDRPGDMDYLLRFVKVDVAVLTDVSGSHVEFFKDISHIGREKWKLIESVSADSNKAAIVNIDNMHVKELLKKHKKGGEINGITFGFSEDCAVRATDVHYHYQGGHACGISFKLNYDGKIIPVRLSNIIARHHIYAVLAAISVGIYFKINPIEIAGSLENFFPPAGRMTFLDGTRGSMIIDDTYNASKVSTLSALGILGEMRSGRKIAVLGDMLELGENSHQDHKEVLRKVASVASEIFVVGKRMEAAAFEIMKRDDVQSRIHVFGDPNSVGEKLRDFVDSGDLVLVKGSQSMRMEKVVENIVLATVDTEKRLCRQSKEWKQRPFIQP